MSGSTAPFARRISRQMALPPARLPIAHAHSSCIDTKRSVTKHILNAKQPVLTVWVDGHGRRPGTYFQGWTPSSHFFDQCSLDGIHYDQLILRKLSKIGATRCQILKLQESRAAARKPRDATSVLFR